VVPGEEFLAAIDVRDAAANQTMLTILNADGSTRLQLPGMQVVEGRCVMGGFSWFESPRSAGANIFGVAFDAVGDNAMFHLDIDAETGRVVSAMPKR
jgi:hypothetical protein